MSNKMALDALTAAQRAINSMKVEAETAGAGGDQEMLQDACEQISNEGLAADTAIRAAIAALQALPQPANLADTPTPKPQAGLWTLTAPDGRTYQADSPLRCCGLEQRERVPADVAMARILRASSEPDDSELLDWLDATNKRFKMGWKVGVAPAGNCSVQSVICLGNSEPVTIRAAIRAARTATPPKD